MFGKRILRMALTAVAMVTVAAAMPVSSSAAKPQVPTPVQKPPKPPTPRLTVDGSSSSTDISFGESGGSQTLSISTNQGKPRATDLPSWITVANSSSTSMTIQCAANTSTSPRSDWFTISAGSKSVRVNVSQSAASKIQITGAEFANEKKDNTIINSYGSTLYASDMRYLCCRLKYNGTSTSETKTIYWKVIKPNGEMMTGKSSPSGYTSSTNVTFQPGNSKTVGIGGWGNDESSSYTTGTYKFEIYWDGTKQYTASVYLNKKAGEATYLTVDNKTSVSASFAGSQSSETFYVSTDADSWTTWGVPSWCTITDKTATSFKIVCEANTSSSSRSDYMKIKAGDKEVKIDITQASGQTAKINKIWVDYNVYSGDQKGMKIHIDFNVNGCKGHTIRPVAYFYFSDGSKLKDYDDSYCTTDGQVSVGYSDDATYDGTHWSDFTLFMPYKQLHLGTGNYDLYFIIDVRNKTTDKVLVSSEKQSFTIK